VGFEALIRWHHPKEGFISPTEFIPLAEENGLIDPIGLFILREACRHLSQLQREFPSQPPLTMSVNLSGIQFLKTELLGQIDLTLREFGLDPASLKLEITESTIIEHAEHAGGMMAQLKAQNIHLSIDDFGTGYSSMSNLRRYPIDTVKIDQSFVRKMCQDEESLEIVKATLTMARNLKKDVIAEGVETAEQLRILKSLGCQYGQGYFFAKPLEQSASRELLASKPKW
jgi:EAL domain-containing protein (putative c-di-GMP-specific phosphodiesterase class I)